jgi:ubiquinone/menaquinone biosynthesis C-methylase UbiE
MSKGFKFDPQKLEKLNDPERLEDIPPGFILEKINIASPETIIDIGAGTGLFSREFARIPTVKKVYALDILDEMIHWMNENLVHHWPNIIPLKMEETSTGLEDNLADIVIMINLYHEFHEPITMLNESYRLLKEGGKLGIVDWAKRETEHGPPVQKRFSPVQILKHLEKTSFQNSRVYEDLKNHFLIVAEK